MTTISAIRHAVGQTPAEHDTVSDGRSAGRADVSAVLLTRDGRVARIASDGCICEARVAFGCVVQPEPGDRVLTAVTAGTIWVTSVLDRRSDAPMLLWAERDIAIVSLHGDVSLTAARTIDLDAAECVRLAACEIDLHAGVARFVLDELVQVSRKASLLVGKVRYVSEMIETFAEHVLTRARRSSRLIEDSDQLRASDIDHRAESTLQLRAETMLMTADRVIRVDADQIHMG
jgi:Protein of unknown function (DUF3540)